MQMSRGFLPAGPNVSHQPGCPQHKSTHHDLWIFQLIHQPRNQFHRRFGLRTPFAEHAEKLADGCLLKPLGGLRDPLGCLPQTKSHVYVCLPEAALVTISSRRTSDKKGKRSVGKKRRHSVSNFSHVLSKRLNESALLI